MDQVQDARVGGSGAAGGEADFLTVLGSHLRQLRRQRGLSRRALSERSGISPRYITQVESGSGNASISLLSRLAAALETPLADIVAPQAPPAVDRSEAELIGLLKAASPAQLLRVRAVLTGGAETAPPGAISRVAVIGLRGAGKSTLGQRSAARLGWRFVELNKEIERAQGLSLTEIFSLFGADEYRRMEQASLAAVIADPGPLVLATGGGLPSDPISFERLLSSFLTIWVKASPAEHMSRVRAQGDLRPMGNDDAAFDKLVEILAEREKLYARAHAVVDTTGETPDESLESMLSIISHGCRAACPWSRGSAIAP